MLHYTLCISNLDSVVALNHSSSRESTPNIPHLSPNIHNLSPNIKPQFLYDITDSKHIPTSYTKLFPVYDKAKNNIEETIKIDAISDFLLLPIFFFLLFCSLFVGHKESTPPPPGIDKSLDTRSDPTLHLA